MEKITCAFLVVILIIAFIMPFSLASPEQTKIYVDPPSIINPEISPSQDITIGIMVANVTDLYIWQIRLHFEPYVLNCTAAWVPPENVFEGLPYYVPPPIIDNEEGYVQIGATLYGVVLGIDGTGKLANISFHVKHRGYTPLHFSPYGKDGKYTYLGDSYFDLISASTEDGFFMNGFLGDVNGDRTVDASDLFVLSEAYGSDPSKPNWNPDCDFNWDGKVDASDLFDLGKNYGRSI